VLACRSRQQRNFLTTLMLSQGVPMLLGGDEVGRSQGGNNNAYCQDNEISWTDWTEVDEDLLDFTRQLVELRAESPTFRRRSWFHGRKIRGVPDIEWLKPDGSSMSDEDWDTGHASSLAMFLNGDAIGQRDRRGRPDRRPLLPAGLQRQSGKDRLEDPAVVQGWLARADRHRRDGFYEEPLPVKGSFTVGPRSTVVLRRLRS
jgi:isoamylase